MPVLLECFCGTKSVSKVFKDWEVISVDIQPKYNPTICCDILQWEGYKELKNVTYAHFSPPCSMWSRCRSTQPHDKAKSEAFVKKTLEIIEYLQPPFVTIENPATSGMCNLTYLGPYKDVCYCMYSDWGYRKATRIWHRGLEGWQPKPMCDKNARCKHFKEGRHPKQAQKGGMRWGSGRAPNEWTQEQLYRMPEELIQEWKDYITLKLNEREV